jgi:hypothetical protein
VTYQLYVKIQFFLGTSWFAPVARGPKDLGEFCVENVGYRKWMQKLIVKNLGLTKFESWSNLG